MIAYLFGLFGPREASRMRHHDPRDLYALGVVHRLLEMKAGHRVGEYAEAFTQVSFILKEWGERPENLELLPNAVEAAYQLRVFLDALRHHAPDWVIEQSTLDYFIQRGFVDTFTAALSLDLKALPLFLIEDKRGYSSRAFLRDASVVLSVKDIKALPKLTLDDIAEAGRCLLLDRFTAAGFHAMRALEAVGRGYYRMVFDAEPVNKNNKQPLGLGAIADYLRKFQHALDSAKRDMGSLGEIIPTLDRIARIYRNNIMHPEMTLDEDLAVEVFDNAKTAIAAMLRDLRSGGSHLKVPVFEFSWAWS